ncbi:MAG: acyl carrier protein [Eubacteriales bacterium]|nr:acyl carrier protein [Clostridiales bacterium]MDO5033319.1 acyl carrier protein [Eubacteriales bacterium]MDY5836162.1 acyl carrier protein [Eubacteriales bacterium]
MTREEIFEKVSQILAEELGLDPESIEMDANFIEDLNADSLDIVDLVVEMEHEFDLSIPDDEAEQIKTVGDAVNYIADNL